MKVKLDFFFVCVVCALSLFKDVQDKRIYSVYVYSILLTLWLEKQYQ